MRNKSMNLLIETASELLSPFVHEVKVQKDFAPPNIETWNSEFFVCHPEILLSHNSYKAKLYIRPYEYSILSILTKGGVLLKGNDIIYFLWPEFSGSMVFQEIMRKAKRILGVQGATANGESWNPKQ